MPQKQYEITTPGGKKYILEWGGDTPPTQRDVDTAVGRIEMQKATPANPTVPTTPEPDVVYNGAGGVKRANPRPTSDMDTSAPPTNTHYSNLVPNYGILGDIAGYAAEGFDKAKEIAEGFFGSSEMNQFAQATGSLGRAQKTGDYSKVFQDYAPSGESILGIPRINSPLDIVDPTGWVSSAPGMVKAPVEDFMQGRYGAMIPDLAMPALMLYGGYKGMKGGEVPPTGEVPPPPPPAPPMTTALATIPRAERQSPFIVSPEGVVLPPDRGVPHGTTIPLEERPPVGGFPHNAPLPTSIRGLLPAAGETHNPLNAAGNPIYEDIMDFNPVSEGFPTVTPEPRTAASRIGVDPLEGLLGPAESGVFPEPKPPTRSITGQFRRIPPIPEPTTIPTPGAGLPEGMSVKDFLREHNVFPKEEPIPETPLPEPAQPTRKVPETPFGEVEPFTGESAAPESLVDKIRRQPDSPARTAALERIIKEEADKRAALAETEAASKADGETLQKYLTPMEKARILAREVDKTKPEVRQLLDNVKEEELAKAKAREETAAQKAAEKAAKPPRKNETSTIEGRLEDALGEKKGGTTAGSGLGGLQPLYEKISDKVGGRIKGKVKEFGERTVDTFESAAEKAKRIVEKGRGEASRKRGDNDGVGLVTHDGEYSFKRTQDPRLTHNDLYGESATGKFADQLFRVEKGDVIWNDTPTPDAYFTVQNEHPNARQYTRRGAGREPLGLSVDPVSKEPKIVIKEGGEKGTNVGMLDLSSLKPLVEKANEARKGTTAAIKKVFSREGEVKPGEEKVAVSKKEVSRPAPINMDEPYGQMMQAIRTNKGLETVREADVTAFRASVAAKMRSVTETGEAGHNIRKGLMKGSAGDKPITNPLNLPQEVIDHMIDAANSKFKDDVYVANNASDAIQELNRGEYVTPYKRQLLSELFPEQYRKEIINLYAGIPFEHLTELAKPARTLVGKALKGIGKWTYGSSKTLKAAYDASFAGIQARGASNTRAYYGAFKKSWDAFHDADLYQKQQAEIMMDPAYKLMKDDMGVHFADLEYNRPDYLKGGNLTLENSKHIQSFHRAAVSFLNDIRFKNAKLFIKLAKERGVNLLETKMVDKKVTYPQLESIGKFVNESTGYGTLSKSVARAEPLLSKGLWSTHLTASRINYLKLFDPREWKSENRFAQKQRAYSAVTMLATSYATLKALELAGAKVHLSPFDPKFGKAEIGDKVIDTTSSFGSLAALVARSIQVGVTGETQGSDGKKISGRIASVPSLTAEYFENKLNPNAAFVDKLVRQTNPFTGKPYNIPAEAIDSVIPMFASNVYDAFKDIIKDGDFKGLFLTVPGFGGLNYYTSDKKKTTMGEDIASGYGLFGPAKPKNTFAHDYIEPFIKGVKKQF